VIIRRLAATGAAALTLLAHTAWAQDEAAETEQTSASAAETAGPETAGSETAGSETPEARYDRLFQQMLDDPDNLDVMFEFARVATQLGRYEPAISTLERMLVYNQNLPRVRLELGVLYFRIGAFDVAQAYFERVASREDLPPEVRSRVDRYLAEIENREARHQFAGSLFFGGRYDTNANAGPNGDDVQFVDGGQVVTGELVEGDADEDVSLVTTGFLRHTYDLETRFDEVWESTALGHATRHADMGGIDVDFLELTTGPRLTVLPGELDDAQLRPFAVGQLIRLDRELLTGSFGGGLEFGVPIGPKLYARADYQLVWKDFDDTSQLPNATDRTGIEQALRTGLTFGLNETFALQGRIGGKHRVADADFESFIEGFVEAGLRARYSAPGDLTPWPWTASVSARVTQTDYNDPDPAIAPNTARDDTELRFSAGNTFRIDETLALELRVQHTINESNIRNYEYDNTSVTLGGVVRF
jgi:tetratricopeptide (TPR) repeat protein